jgi:hypothetical protein
MVLNIKPNVLEKLDRLAKEKYRGTNRCQALRWLIEDMFDMQFAEESVENEKKLLNTGNFLHRDGRID